MTHDTVTVGVPGADVASPAAQVEAQLSVLFSNGRRIMRDAAKMVHPELQPSGLYILQMLDRRGAMRPSAVADYLEVDRSAVSRLIVSVESLGLVERLSDPDDRRSYRVALTVLAKEGLGRVSWPLRDALQDWAPDELEVLARLLEKLNTGTTQALHVG
jgi:DNA-binding MarR family transcriptional regulator